MTEKNTDEKKELKVEDLRVKADEKVCPVQKALFYITEFLAGPMCGRCFPCSMGSYEAKIRLDRLVSGAGAEADIAAVRRIAADMAESSLCKKGKDTARFILDWMAEGVFDEHVAGNCPAMACDSLVVYRIDQEKCIACGLCKEACSYGAIHGEKRKSYMSGYPAFEIRQKRCVKCDACRKVCPETAIARTSKKAELVVL